MKIEADAFIDHPVSEVFRVYRDELPRIANGLPRVREIVVVSREEMGDEVRLVNLWRGSAQVPAVAEKILPPMVSWHDHAVWDASTHRCSWRIESDIFPEAVKCQGENLFVDVGGRTRVEIRGEIRIDLAKVRLVPELVAGSIAQAVERFLVRQITPTLTSVSDALADYLDD